MVLRNNQDFSEPLSTILTAVDIHKGFNKVDHIKTITILSDTMKVPGWLTRIVASYLSSRTLKIRYQKATSSSRDMPGGLGAGTILGLNLFLILFNGAGPAANNLGIGQQISQPINKRQPMQECKVKWIDDVTLAAALDLKTALVPEDRPVARPLPYHARTEHRLPLDCNPMQDMLTELSIYTNSHKMAINRKKTKAMLCNSRRKWDFIPELSFEGGENVEIVDELKVVGFILRSDMKTCSNTAYLTTKAYKRMWLIRRLKYLRASTTQLIDSLQKQVLSVLWLGAPAWYCLLTLSEKHDIDRVAKVGLKIIYGNLYQGFENALCISGIRKPTLQLEKMTEQFAKKSSKHNKFSKWFAPVPEQRVNTRWNKHQTYVHISARTDRFKQSPIPQLTDILNKHTLM